MSLDTIPEYPVTRIESYLAKIAGDEVETPTPVTRIEQYLARIAEGGLSGGVTSVTATENAGIEIGGTENDPTVGIKLSSRTGNDLVFATGSGEDGGLYFNVAVQVKSSPNTGYLKTYQLVVNGTPLPVDIDIPKDFLVKSGEVKTVVTPDVPYDGAVVGDKYIDFVINVTSGTATDEHLYLPVNELVDAYNAGNGLELGANNTFAIKIDSTNSHGLATTANGLRLNVDSAPTENSNQTVTSGGIYTEFSTLRRNIAEDYDNMFIYAVGDYAMHNGSLYICNTAMDTAEAWTAAHWTATTLDAQLDLKAPLASPALTGVPTAPTAANGTNTTQIATTEFVQSVAATKAPLDSPALTGTPTAPTAADGTNTTQLATTAFVQTAAATKVSIVQGAENAGKILGVGSDGNVFLQQPQAFQFYSDSLPPTLHRTLFRGESLGTEITAEQKAQIRANTFGGLWLGDYWTINNIVYRIVDINYWINCGTSGNGVFTSPHLVVMPDWIMYTAKMNDGLTTAGGYVNSKMRTTYLASAQATIENAFGDALLTHKELFTNATSNGKPSGGAWVDSKIDLPNETMMFGSSIFTPANDGSTITALNTIDKTQLALMAACPEFIIARQTSGQTYWLRDVASSTNFVYAGGGGSVTHDTASSTRGVRPVFAVG